MPLARFRVIASQLRFDDEESRRGPGGRWQGDRFAAIRSVSTSGLSGNMIEGGGGDGVVGGDSQLSVSTNR
jgi:hypothetical protein